MHLPRRMTFVISLPCVDLKDKARAAARVRTDHALVAALPAQDRDAWVTPRATVRGLLPAPVAWW